MPNTPSPVNPSRTRLDALISSFAATLTAGSRVLDAGSASAPYRAHFSHCRYETCDLHGSVTYKSNLTSIPVNDGCFDSVLCTQVLEHVEDPAKVLTELSRVLKEGGSLFVSAPFFYEEHLTPHDYFRFTQFGLRSLLSQSGFEIRHHQWLEGFSCAVYYFLTYAARELETHCRNIDLQHVPETLNALAEVFLDHELNNPILNCGFPKNHVFICIKKTAFSNDVALIQRIINDKLTYLSNSKFYSLRDTIDRVQQQNIRGDYCDFGVALGGSSIFIASKLPSGAHFYGFDIFGRIPAPGLMDDKASHERYGAIASGASAGIQGEVYYGYINNLFDVVCDNFKKHGLTVDGQTINLIKGRYEEFLTNTERPVSVSFAHIDCDWYGSVKHVLQFLKQRMSLGGYIIIDDFNAWGGARKATLEFLAQTHDFALHAIQPHAIIRRGAHPN